MYELTLYSFTDRLLIDGCDVDDNEVYAFVVVVVVIVTIQDGIE
jgi:hypothetical protein